MTISRVRAPVEGLASGERTLDPAAARYLTRVRRLGEGDRFVAFDPKVAKEAEATIVRAGDDVVIQVGALSDATIVAPRAITWIQGLPKGPKADAVVRDATELGATEIVLASTARSVVRLEERGASRVARWEKIAREAARQSERADAPRVHLASWSDAVTRVSDEAARFCLFERATTPLGPLLRVAMEERVPLCFAAGPEGGLADAEVEAATEAGFAVVSLGKILLRTETVAAAVLGAVRVLD